ncbi:hypothetical protein BC829DRAFT_449357 [Chytridium lagenaria]|nr:hypothetical protein BC829DRAFT_449357 [Chytridium lagenaria]
MADEVLREHAFRISQNFSDSQRPPSISLPNGDIVQNDVDLIPSDQGEPDGPQHEEEEDEVEKRKGGLPLGFERIRGGLSEVGVSSDSGRGAVFLKLGLPNAGLEDISFVKYYVHLQTVCLSGNRLTDLSPLDSLPHLVRLDASDNLLTDFTFPTAKMDPPFFNLQELDLSRNQFLVAPDLSTHRFLKRLNVDGNRIQSLEALGSLPCLTHLSAARNEIVKVDFRDGERVKVLDLRYNQLSSLRGVENMTSLEELRVGHNSIDTLEGLINPSTISEDTVRRGHKWLRILDLESNALQTIEEVEGYLSGLPMLTTLTVNGNPFQKPLQDLGIRRPRRGEDAARQAKAQNLMDARVSDDEGFRQTRARKATSASTATSTSSREISPLLIGSPYRLAILYRLPRLTVLDSLPVTCKEKVSALNRHAPPAMVIAAEEHAHRLQRQSRLYARIKTVDLLRAERLRPIVLCGPNGVGKRTLTRRLLAEFPHIYGVAVSHTTRKPRNGEEDGVHYHFVKRKEMERMVEEGRFLEVVDLFGQMYGTSVEAIDRVTEEGKVCVMDLEIEGVLALKRTHLKPYYIFITVPSLGVLQQRLEDRMRRSAGASVKKTPLKQPEEPEELATCRISVTETEEPLAAADRASVAGTDLGDVSVNTGFEDHVLEATTDENDTEGAAERVTRSVQDDVRQWMAKAGEITEELEGYLDAVREGAVDGKKEETGKFFDFEVMNDNSERAYQVLKEFCLSKYWEGYSEED